MKLKNIRLWAVFTATLTLAPTVFGAALNITDIEQRLLRNISAADQPTYIAMKKQAGFKQAALYWAAYTNNRAVCEMILRTIPAPEHLAYLCWQDNQKRSALNRASNNKAGFVLRQAAKTALEHACGRALAKLRDAETLGRRADTRALGLRWKRS